MTQIAIHHTKNSFSERWIAYCERKSIPYKLVDCYRNDILDQIKDCTALMWHFHHANPKSVLFAKQLMYSVQAMGKMVFPDFNTCWHFDDKIGQRYLMDAINAPIIPTYIFYTKKEALNWANVTSYPKVFKLSKGAGSANVQLVHTKSRAVKLINQAFGRGFSQYEGWSNLKERIRKYRNHKTDLKDVFRGVIRLFYKTEFARFSGREKGYVYFQEFIEKNDSDIRVIVIGNKAFAMKRMIRKNDFRASGSGDTYYLKELFDEKTIKLSFEITQKLNTQCVAFDFVYKNAEPLLVEISYGFAIEIYDPCPGYWDNELNWHDGNFIPQNWMVDLMIN